MIHSSLSATLVGGILPSTPHAPPSLDHLEERDGEDHAEQHDTGDADADATDDGRVVLDEGLDAVLAADLEGGVVGAGVGGFGAARGG